MQARSRLGNFRIITSSPRLKLNPSKIWVIIYNQKLALFSADKSAD